MKIPDKIYLYRMVHWLNVEYILRHGLCRRGHQLEDPAYINIGMRKLIEDRHDLPIPIEGKGNLGEYIPFYFAGHSPMLYIIKNGFSGVEKRPQMDIVYIVCKYETIKNNNLPFVFTDRNAKIAVAKFYTDEKDLNRLDWNSIRAKDWGSDETNLARRDLKQAEFLIKNHVPVSCIHVLVVKTQERKDYFEEMITNLGLQIKVHIDNSCKLYY